METGDGWIVMETGDAWIGMETPVLVLVMIWDRGSVDRESMDASESKDGVLHFEDCFLAIATSGYFRIG